ncbi:hypothetical protein [Pseudomonas sp. 5P_3.1_Bac2]|uniref:hypothetical protein n=1 Tax=Pseudomonas sp. 5P_3.1_Bac2 TaxID=2971617 RepID=UPI0021C6B4C6|nr:hypothetical protein [Pseudomonas sp. 5P_3.1_Bac2]MCU1716677.1 hypothetical protein [Pseudomonas sp. 5P_3.1_Bac2]
MAKISVSAFEAKVFELEEVRIVVRADPNALVEDYDYQRGASGVTSITRWLDTRVKPLLGDFKAVVVDGEGSIPNGRTHMAKLKKSYID